MITATTGKMRSRPILVWLVCVALLLGCALLYRWLTRPQSMQAHAAVIFKAFQSNDCRTLLRYQIAEERQANSTTVEQCESILRHVKAPLASMEPGKVENAVLSKSQGSVEQTWYSKTDPNSFYRTYVLVNDIEGEPRIHLTGFLREYWYFTYGPNYTSPAEKLHGSMRDGMKADYTFLQSIGWKSLTILDYNEGEVKKLAVSDASIEMLSERIKLVQEQAQKQ